MLLTHLLVSTTNYIPKRLLSQGVWSHSRVGQDAITANVGRLELLLSLLPPIRDKAARVDTALPLFFHD